MLSFPAPRWRAALTSVTVQKTGRPAGSRFGRTASLIVPRVYLSDAFTARDEAELIRLGITHVISVLEYNPTIPDIIPEERKLHIRLADQPNADILSHLPETTQFITLALAENEANKVLVHCFQGISRSATVVCAYLIASCGMLSIETLEYTQAKRGIVCPNSGFRQQLDTYAEGFVGGRKAQGVTRVAKMGGDIAERIRQLRSASLPRHRQN
ncbi:protein-tyrosine phosphatase-like protein [Lyophyllum atratum]|nr:protein-tyrosine phosphatase-like protein [Lyophyllum atratum]